MGQSINVTSDAMKIKPVLLTGFLLLHEAKDAEI